MEQRYWNLRYWFQLARMEEKAELQDLIAKCVENINSGNDVGVTKVWKQIVKNHNKTQNILNEIIVDAYGGKRENILPLIRFIVETARCSGFETLFREMSDYGHFYDGVEIFSLANAILNHCNYAMFQKLPNTVQWILTKNVSLQNTFSKGYLYRKPNTRDNGLENQIATTKNANHTDYFRFVPANENGDVFMIRHRNANLVASPSRRLYFANLARSRFTVEMKKNEEINIGVDLDTAGGRKFYRLYVQKTKGKSADHYDVNLWTINPGDEYGKYIYWIVQEQE